MKMYDACSSMGGRDDFDRTDDNTRRVPVLHIGTRLLEICTWMVGNVARTAHTLINHSTLSFHWTMMGVWYGVIGGLIHQKRFGEASGRPASGVE